jgi:hypothetical protein
LGEYRRAVEERSPWMRDVKDPQLVCIQDIEATDLPESLKEIVRAEQICALAFPWWRTARSLASS